MGFYICESEDSVGLCPLACWDCGFKSLRGHGCLSLVNVVWCQAVVSATGRSLLQGSPSDYVCDTECDSDAAIILHTYNE
jgi:hypothetical protein